MTKSLVTIESPYAGDIVRNVEYARALMHDRAKYHGEAPFAMHLLFTQPGILDDGIAEERALGIELGLAWSQHAEKTYVGIDLGVSNGMRQGVAAAVAAGRPVELVRLGWKRFWLVWWHAYGDTYSLSSPAWERPETDAFDRETGAALITAGIIAPDEAAALRYVAAAYGSAWTVDDLDVRECEERPSDWSPFQLSRHHRAPHMLWPAANVRLEGDQLVEED